LKIVNRKSLDSRFRGNDKTSMLSKDEVKKIANLARIEISEEEAEKYATELSDILGFVEKLNEADTDEVEPIAHITGAKNVIREDRVVEYSDDTKESIINNFPEKKDRFNKVKAVF
jgi:aspartyl-tRNA(Asn)/glutamyl-tRNA(Gln) amidotransferase subunit C